MPPPVNAGNEMSTAAIASGLHQPLGSIILEAFAESRRALPVARYTRCGLGDTGGMAAL